MTETSPYTRLLSSLFAIRRDGIVFGLSRVQGILERLGNPERRMGIVVHVGGTNGKGSTVAMLDAILRRSGARVARYSSPHLTSLRERIVIDGAPISEAAIVEVSARVDAAGGEALTFFERITVIAMLAFADAAPDVTLLEVGLGGRLDATNVVDAEIAVVTGVALDHQALLGDTLELIAAEKAGIFKAGQSVIIGASGEPAAVEVLAAAAKRVGAGRIELVHAASASSMPTLGLRGSHQRSNAASAVSAYRELVRCGITSIGDAAIHDALASATHPGRFETVARAPDIILDGAHNPHGAAALARAMADLPRPRVLLLGVSADKDVAGMVDALRGSAEHVIATRYDQPRALVPTELADACRSAGLANVAAMEKLDAAIARARELTGRHGTIVIAGSLLLVGQARALLVADVPVDPFVVTDPSVAAPSTR